MMSVSVWSLLRSRWQFVRLPLCECALMDTTLSALRGRKDWNKRYINAVHLLFTTISMSSTGMQKETCKHVADLKMFTIFCSLQLQISNSRTLCVAPCLTVLVETHCVPKQTPSSCQLEFRCQVHWDVFIVSPWRLFNWKPQRLEAVPVRNEIIPLACYYLSDMICGSLFKVSRLLPLCFLCVFVV